MANELHDLKPGMMWNDAKGFGWEIIENLSFGKWRVARTDRSRVGEMFGREIRAEMKRSVATNTQILKASLPKITLDEQKDIFEDAEALKAMRYLASKYTSEQIIDQWWRMERGK